MQAWVTRSDPSDPDSGTLNADQAITLEQAVYGYTRGGIECLGFDWPEKLGSLPIAHARKTQAKRHRQRGVPPRMFSSKRGRGNRDPPRDQLRTNHDRADLRDLDPILPQHPEVRGLHPAGRCQCP